MPIAQECNQNASVLIYVLPMYFSDALIGLAEPRLTPANTAAALGISVRHLHLLFEPTGTSFAQYIARRRLLQCRAALTSPTGTQRSVADIAFGWGFNSLATFYRAFEREFGLPPAALCAVGVAGHGD